MMKTAFDLPEQVRSLSRFPIPVAIATSLAVPDQSATGSGHPYERLARERIDLRLRGSVPGKLRRPSVGDQPESRHQRKSWNCDGSGRCRCHHPVFSRRRLQQSLIELFGLALAAMGAAHLRRAAAIESFWRFNLQLGIAVAMVLVAALDNNPCEQVLKRAVSLIHTPVSSTASTHSGISPSYSGRP